MPLNQGSLRGSYAVEVCDFCGIAAGDVDGSTITLRWVLQGAKVQLTGCLTGCHSGPFKEKQRRNSVTVQLWLSLVNMRSLLKFSRIESTMWQQTYLLYRIFQVSWKYILQTCFDLCLDVALETFGATVAFFVNSKYLLKGFPVVFLRHAYNRFFGARKKAQVAWHPEYPTSKHVYLPASRVSPRYVEKQLKKSQQSLMC